MINSHHLAKWLFNNGRRIYSHSENWTAWVKVTFYCFALPLGHPPSNIHLNNSFAKKHAYMYLRRGGSRCIWAICKCTFIFPKIIKVAVGGAVLIELLWIQMMCMYIRTIWCTYMICMYISYIHVHIWCTYMIHIYDVHRTTQMECYINKATSMPWSHIYQSWFPYQYLSNRCLSCMGSPFFPRHKLRISHFP